jgi:hypothetical protein
MNVSKQVSLTSIIKAKQFSIKSAGIEKGEEFSV